MSKKIILISSGQPSLNPRLVKEADTLADAGNEVIVLYQYWNEWGTELDKKLLSSKNWSAYRVGGAPTNEKFSYFSSRVLYKITRFLVQQFNFKKKIADNAIGRCTPLLLKKASSIKADIYIGHNLAALPATVLAAKKNNAKCGFDAEDFHRNEMSDNPSDFDVKLKTLIENKYISKLDYLSTASPLITKAYKNLYPHLSPVSILNVFSKQNINKYKTIDSHPLKLFWFSQTIGINRGLENVVRAIGKSNIELHLLGNYDKSIKTHFMAIAAESNLSENRIYFYKPIPPEEIFAFASQFDIGLATEISYPKNRDICLTNKIFTYIQSNLAIIASNTSAQTTLLEEYPDMGLVYEKDSPESLAELLKLYIDNRTLLTDHQKQARKYADENLNWEIEKQKILDIIKQTLNN